MSKVTDFVKKHKTEIAVGTIGVIAVISGCAIFAITKKVPKASEILEHISENSYANRLAKEKERIANLSWSFGDMTDLWNEGPNTHMIVQDVKLADLGKFGEECLKFNDTTDETLISMILGFDGDKLS